MAEAFVHSPKMSIRSASVELVILQAFVYILRYIALNAYRLQLIHDLLKHGPKRLL